MTRKIIIDCDPGIDDAVAICMALFDPGLEVLAITATAGTVSADQATNNVSAIVGNLDPVRYPRVGKASVPKNGTVTDDKHLHGPDGLAGCHFEATPRQNRLPSEKVIAELLRAHPDEITLVCLGPLTNLARLCQLDPTVIKLVDKVVISGGAVEAAGNASPVAEFNMYFDAPAAADVFASATTKSLVPLDVTDRVTFGIELLDQLPPRYTRAGQLLHKILPFALRAAHQRLGRELAPIYDATVMLAVVEPELFGWQDLPAEVETKGERTHGMTVFDRRLRPEKKPNLEVATRVNEEDAKASIIRMLQQAGRYT